MWKQGEISQASAGHAGTKTVGGTEREENAKSETKVSPLSAWTRGVRCVASSNRHSISSSSRGQLAGGGLVLGSILRQLHQSPFAFRYLAVEHAPDLDVLTLRSNDYSRNIGVTSNWKALLLNKVVVGNGKKLVKDDTSLTQPPPGFDSVCHLEAALWRR